MKLGNYDVQKKIGEGGFGAIYQAEHVLLGEKACIKQNKEASPVDARILIAEAKLLWRLDCYHSVPTVKEVFEVEKNNLAMAMTFIEGKTIDDIVKGHSRLHAEDVCWITERLLGALRFCHYYGVIHGDVKPANVFVEPKKHDIKLIDFGLAVYMPTSTTAPIGYTPAFAAPEITQGKPPIPQTDIYGAGMVMLHALGGDLMKRTFPSDVPEPLVEFCNSLIKYDPMQRPSWEKDDPLEKLSELRLKVFGRKHMSTK